MYQHRWLTHPYAGLAGWLGSTTVYNPAEIAAAGVDEYVRRVCTEAEASVRAWWKEYGPQPVETPAEFEARAVGDCLNIDEPDFMVADGFASVERTDEIAARDAMRGA